MNCSCEPKCARVTHSAESSPVEAVKLGKLNAVIPTRYRINLKRPAHPHEDGERRCKKQGLEVQNERFRSWSQPLDRRDCLQVIGVEYDGIHALARFNIEEQFVQFSDDSNGFAPLDIDDVALEYLQQLSYWKALGHRLSNSGSHWGLLLCLCFCGYACHSLPNGIANDCCVAKYVRTNNRIYRGMSKVASLTKT